MTLLEPWADLHVTGEFEGLRQGVGEGYGAEGWRGVGGRRGVGAVHGQFMAHVAHSIKWQCYQKHLVLKKKGADGWQQRATVLK